MSSPTLTLDVESKEAILIPLALHRRLNELVQGSGRPAVHLKWDKGAPLSLAAGSEKAEGLEASVKLLLSLYAETGITGKDASATVEITSLVNLSLTLAGLPFAQATQIADTLDQQLALRTYLTGAGHALTAADVCTWGAFRSSPPLMGLTKKGQHVHLARWLSHMDSRPACVAALDDQKTAKLDKARSASKQASSFAIFLPDAKEGQVVTRFPPEPSGYLHVGHAKAAILNQYFAKQYKGKLIIRFDDTNPSKEKVEFEDSIVEDLALMGIKGDSVSHTSDYFDELYRLVIQLIKQGDAYADDTVQEEMRAQRMDGIASARRDASIEENLARFADMMTGSDEGKRWCLRAKMSVDNPNKAMRDPVIYRCNDTPHHRAGSTWKVYPTYDFACPVVDSLEGVTHALRTNEYTARNPQYQWFLDKLNLRKVAIWDFGRLNFVYTLLSKRKLQWFVDNGHVAGWDDPRFPTVRGIRRRGMTVDCIHQFILATGPSSQVINMEWDAIWSSNKRMLDPVVPRYTALETKGLVKARLNGVSDVTEKSVPKHKKNAELGNKTTVYGPDVLLEQEDAATLEEGEKLTLMDWGNVVVKSISKAADGSVTSLTLDAALEDQDFKKTKKLTWLADSPTRKPFSVTLVDFDYLINKKKLEEDDKFEDFLTPQTEFRSEALVDANVSEVKEGEAIQFERKGYYILDKRQGKEGKFEFFRIPDGSAEGSKSKAAPEENVDEKRRAAKEAREKAKSGAAPKASAAGASSAPVGAATAPLPMYTVKQVSEDIPMPNKVSDMYTVRPFI